MAKAKRQTEHLDLGSKLPSCTIVQFPLFPNEVEKVSAIKIDPKDVLDGLALLVETGHEVVLTPNTYSGGYSVCVRAAFTETVNAGKAYYSNAPTTEMALQVACFKHFTVASGKEWRIQSEPVKNTLS